MTVEFEPTTTSRDVYWCWVGDGPMLPQWPMPAGVIVCSRCEWQGDGAEPDDIFLREHVYICTVRKPRSER